MFQINRVEFKKDILEVVTVNKIIDTIFGKI